MEARTQILFSIVIPVYNVQRYLRDCLESVVSQSLREIEILCVNDGSTDSSLTILQEYGASDSRMKIISKPNEGQAIARNVALSLASGKYVIFVDSDDAIDRDLCKKVYLCAEEAQSEVVVFDYDTFEDIKEVSRKVKKWSPLSTIGNANRLALLKQMGVVWTKCVRTDFIRSNQVRFESGRIYEDVSVHWQIVTQAKTLAILPEKLYHYRVRPTATTQRTDWKITDRVVAYDRIRQFLISRDLYEGYQDVFLESQLDMFSWLHDTIGTRHKGAALALIQDHLGKEHWDYLDSGRPLSWRTRDFHNAIRGSKLARWRRRVWFFARDCYRFVSRERC